MKTIRKQTWIKYTALFLLMAVILFVPFALQGKTFIWTNDGYHQHYPFFREYLTILREFIATGDWRFYDWSIGLGQDTLMTYGYYVIGDPFVYLGLLFAKGSEELAFHAIMLVRIWTVGASLLLYARKMNVRENSALAGTMLYTFSHYVVYNLVRHPFFIHPMIFFPLIALGIEKIYRKESGALFAVMIGVSAISNFYFFYMLTLMSLLYAVLRYRQMESDNHWLVFAKWFGKFLGFYLLGILLSAVVFLPQVYGFLKASRSAAFPPISLFLYPFNYYWFLLINSVTPGTIFWTVGGWSIVAILTLPFLARNRKKQPGLFWVFILLGVLLLFPFLGSLMNGMSGPYNRFTFILPFYMAIALMYFMEEIETLTATDLKWMRWLLIGLTVFYGVVSVVYSEYIFYLTPILVGWGMYYVVKSYPTKIPFGKLMIALVLFNLATNALNFHMPYGKSAMNGTEDAGTIDEDYANVFGGLEQELPTDEWYRLGVSSQDNHVRNHYAYLDVMGLNSYASLTNGVVAEFSQMLEASSYQIIQPLRSGVDDRRIVNEALGVEYIITDAENVEFLPAGYEVIKEKEGKILAKTDYAAPFAYVENEAVLREERKDLHPVQRESVLAEAVILEEESDIVQPLKETPKIATHAGSWAIGEGIEVKGDILQVTEAEAEMIFTFEHPEDLVDQEVFLYFEGIDYKPLTDRFGVQESTGFRLRTFFNHQEKSVYQSDHYSFSSYFKRENILIHLNEVEEAENTLSVQFDHVGNYNFDEISIVSRPYDELQTASFAEGKNERALVLESFEDEYVAGTVSGKAGMLVTTIPYSNGWTALVDGEEVPTEQVNVGFVGVPVPEGEHEVEFVYETPLLKVGLVLTVVGVIGVMIVYKGDF